MLRGTSQLVLENGPSNFWGPFASFADVFVQAAVLELNVYGTPYLIQPLEATKGCMTLVPEPYQHRI